MVRFSSRVRTGRVRMEVAVGTVRLASMFSTMRMAPPRMGWAMSPGRMAGTTSAFDLSRGDRGAGGWLRTRVAVRAGDSAGGAGWAAGWSTTVTVPGAGAGFFTPSRRSKYSRQLGSTTPGSALYCSSRSRAKV
jgi:hypothetical protein